jgi:peptidoglycan/xylan/chitin deacetylase (PgdA/CDA1 family)
MTPGPTRRELLVALPALALAACTGAAKRRTTAPTGATSTTTTTARVARTTAPTEPGAVAGGPARFVRSGPQDPSAVAFTFHGAGDVGLLDQLLGMASAHQAPLTIFAVGQWLDANPTVARRILAAGHELANHTYTHPSLGRLAADKVAVEVTRGRDALIRHAGSPGRWFRPSGVEVPGAVILTAAGAAGYATVVGYDVDPHDYQDPGAAAVRARTAAGLHAGAIVSLHTGHAGTVQALGGILGDAAAKGLRPVTVSELLRA